MALTKREGYLFRHLPKWQGLKSPVSSRFGLAASLSLILSRIFKWAIWSLPASFCLRIGCISAADIQALWGSGHFSDLMGPIIMEEGSKWPRVCCILHWQCLGSEGQRLLTSWLPGKDQSELQSPIMYCMLLWGLEAPRTRMTCTGGFFSFKNKNRVQKVYSGARLKMPMRWFHN